MTSAKNNESVDLNEFSDLMAIFREIKEEKPGIDEMELITALASISGKEKPPIKKKEIKQQVFKLLKINP